MQIILTTLLKNNAKKIKEEILTLKLAVCTLELESNSMFLWKGKIEEEKEVLLVFKTNEKLARKLVEKLKEIHPYDIPFIAVLDVKANEEYLSWMNEEINKN
ncbi:MAG: divalent-cation tolerance protein CutA [Candidatus Aenigmatarchaeota archaeon]